MTILPETHTRVFAVQREGGAPPVALTVTTCAAEPLRAARGTFLHPAEEARLQTAGVPKRQLDFLRGRYAAKAALAALHPGLAAPAVEIAAGVFGQPVVRGAAPANAQVSLAHCDGAAAALAFDEAHPMAVDLERHDPRHAETIRREATAAELAALAAAGVSEPHRLTLLWAVREALAKVLRTGLMAPLAFYEIGEATPIVGGVRCTSRHFAQYDVQGYLIGELALALALPRKSVLPFDGRLATVAPR